MEQLRFFRSCFFYRISQILLFPIYLCSKFYENKMAADIRLHAVPFL